jgi:hypothetical protein
MNRKRNKRIPDELRIVSTRFVANKDHIVAVIPVHDTPKPLGTIGIRFNTVNEMMRFFQSALEAAAVVWPDDPTIKEYLK